MLGAGGTCLGKALGLPGREKRVEGGLAAHHTTIESQQLFHMTHASLTVQDVTQSVWVCFILFYIYIFWYPVHCSGCEDSILIFVQSLI